MARRPMGIEELINLSNVGGFQLPQELRDTWQAYRNLLALELPPIGPAPEPDQLNAAVARGESPDLLQLGRDVLAFEAEAQARDRGQRMRDVAVEQRTEELTTLARDLAEQIIEQCLAPAYDELLTEAGKIAPGLSGYPLDQLDLEQLMAEDNRSRKARSAYNAAKPLARKRDLLAQARYRAAMLSGQTPEHDVNNAFVVLRTPQALLPDWEPDTRPLPVIPVPDHPVKKLLWLVGAGKAGTPWLPSPRQQDAAWLDVFGESLRRREVAASAWPRIM